MDELLEVKRNLSLWKDEIGAIKSELIFRRLIRATIKAGFDPNQPRDERGQWSSEGGVGVTTSSGFLTGISSIDETSEALSDILIGVMEKLEYLPTMSPSQYGVAVHVAFAAALWWRGLPGVGDIEQSFSRDTVDPYYGLAGTIRTDATLRNAQGEIIAIYDVKTGAARISLARANQLRQWTGAAPNTPVFELNVVRGISRKSKTRPYSYSLHLMRALAPTTPRGR
jgi:hypothetical protein